MSEVRKHSISSLVSFDTNTFSIDPQPGDMVRFYMDPNSIGTVVERIDDEVCEVLWSIFPNTWDKVVRPVNYSQTAQQTFQVQPMPQGFLPFYLDMVEKRMKGDE